MDGTYNLNGAFKPTTKRFADLNGPDFYPTPAWATHALIASEKFEGDIWEPACGDGAMADVLAVTLLGMQPGSYARTLPAAPQPAALPGIPVNETPQGMLENRPDIITAEARLKASNARIGSAVSQYYPKISLSGILGFESLDAGQFFTSAAFQPQAVAGLRWRLFDFGKVNDEVLQAKGAYAEELADYRSTVLAATGDVENAFMALAQDEQEQIELQNEVSSLTNARDSSQRAYTDGAIPLTDVLDADRELLQTQDQLVLNQADTEQDSVSVFRALGGGW